MAKIMVTWFKNGKTEKEIFPGYKLQASSKFLKLLLDKKVISATMVKI